MTIAQTKRVKKLDAAMGTPEKKARLKALYSDILKLLKLKTKQLELILELVLSVAQREMTTELERLGIDVSIDNYEEMLRRYIPWKMTPKDCPVRQPFTMVSGHALGVLKGQVDAMQSTLGAIVDIDTPEDGEAHAPEDTKA